MSARGNKPGVKKGDGYAGGWTKGKKRPHNPNLAMGGRKKGAKNLIPKKLKEMILEALSEIGGVDYLIRQAEENPGPFMTLLGKILPTEVVGADGKSVVIEIVQFGGTDSDPK